MMLRLWLLMLSAGLAAPAAAQSPAAVDHHQHFFSPTIAARVPDLPMTDAKRLVGLLDDAGIRQAVVLSLAYSYGNPNRPPVDREYDLVKAENDWTSAQVALYPDRLRAFCSVNPLKDYALDEIARCAADPHLRLGLKLHFGNSDVDLATPEHAARLRAVFAAANRHRMAIAVHMRSNISQGRPYGAAYARTFLEQLLPAAPDVPVQIAHLAGAGGYDDPTVDKALGVFVDAIAKGDPRLRRVYFDVSGVAGLGRWKARLPQIVKRIRQLGLARVLYGSDGAGGPDLTPTRAWAAFRELPLTNAEFSAIATNVAPYLR